MGLQHIGGQINYDSYCAVSEATWGYLAPAKNKTYRGEIVFALGCFGDEALNPTVLHFDFGDLDSSPWLYDAMIEHLQDLGGEEGRVYRARTTFRNYKWWSKVEVVFSPVTALQSKKGGV